MRFSREDLAELAGYYNGEGCTHASKVRKYIYPECSIGSTHKPNLLKVQEILGVGNIVQRIPKQLNWSISWNWKTTKHQDSQLVISLLWFRLAINGCLMFYTPPV